MPEKQYPPDVIAVAHAFRSIMSAVSRPGRILPFRVDHQVPSPLWATSAAVARTLCDFQTPVWLAPELGSEAVTHYICFHTGAPIVNRPEEASYLFVAAGDGVADPGLFAQGSHEYPDRSATVVIQAGSLSNSGDVELSGPGMHIPLKLHVEGLTPRFWEAMAANHAQFPLGIDVIFVSPDAIAALPRSTAIRLQEAV